MKTLLTITICLALTGCGIGYDETTDLLIVTGVKAVTYNGEAKLQYTISCDAFEDGMREEEIEVISKKVWNIGDKLEMNKSK